MNYAVNTIGCTNAINTILGVQMQFFAILCANAVYLLWSCANPIYFSLGYSDAVFVLFFYYGSYANAVRIIVYSNALKWKIILKWIFLSILPPTMGK